MKIKPLIKPLIPLLKILFFILGAVSITYLHVVFDYLFENYDALTTIIFGIAFIPILVCIVLAPIKDLNPIAEYECKKEEGLYKNKFTLLFSLFGEIFARVFFSIMFIWVTFMLSKLIYLSFLDLIK